MELLGTAGILALFMAALFWCGRALVKKGRNGRLLYALCGVSSLFTLHALGTGVGVNVCTLLLSGVLGVPGTALVWILGVL